MESDDLLCSRNARLKKALVGRGQGNELSCPVQCISTHTPVY